MPRFSCALRISPFFFFLSPRYINDHADCSKINAEFVKDKKNRRANVTALRSIEPGEEIYASYGEGYWRLRPGVVDHLFKEG